MSDKKLVCRHLSYDLMYEGEIFYFLYFTGNKQEFNLICESCVMKKEFEFVPVYDQRILKFFSKPLSYVVSVVGEPEIMVAPEERFCLRRLSSRVDSSHLLSAIGSGGEDPIFYLLYAIDSRLVLRSHDFLSGELLLEKQFGEVPNLDLGSEVRFKISPDRSLMAVVNPLGQYGLVYDIRDELLVMRLDRGDYHNKHCEFSYEFISVRGEQLLICATQWNRLDIIEVRTGYVLTNRVEDENYRFLDYFHCGISVSPEYLYIVDNGWMWAPVGVMKVWRIQRWLEDPWTSDDETRQRTVVITDYFWDRPLCWLNSHQLVYYGFGTDSVAMIPAAVIYDVKLGKTITWFPGPKGFFSSFDQYLCCHENEEFTIWDTDEGTRVFYDRGDKVISFDPRSRSILRLREDHLYVEQIVEKGAW